MYNLQGERYNLNMNKIYNVNSTRPKLRKNLALLSENYINNLKTPISQKLPYLYTNFGNSNMTPIFNSYQFGNNIVPNDYNFYQNNRLPKLVMGLPIIIHKAKKLKDKNFTPNITKNNFKGIKKNISNLVVSNIISETINTPPRINSPEKELKIEKIKLKKKSKNNKHSKNFNYKIFMKKNITEDNLERNIKPFFTTEMKINYYKKWLNLLRYFVEIYYFFSVLKKYTQKIKIIREKEIYGIEDNLIEEIHVVRNWMLEIQGKYWSDLIKYKSINTAFTEYDSVDKINKSSKIFLKLVDNYLYNLKIQTNDITQIPEEVQKIIYKYIKKNAYFPEKYLNLFHIKRLYFDFYGSCSNNTLEQSAMNLCYLLICSITVQQIFLNIKYLFKKLKPYENISITTKYIGSIIYYLEREAFLNKTKINNDYLNLFNYYRCYKCSNIIIEDEKNISILLGNHKTLSIMKYNEDINNDIYNKLLIEDIIIDKFWENNSKIMKKFSDSLALWSINLAKLILNKFYKKNK